MQTQKTKNDSEYRNIAAGLLEESPTNPRKRFDENTLQELAASIKSQGLLEPLLVRGREQEQGRYEVIVGARRLRAAKLAGLEAVLKIKSGDAAPEQLVKQIAEYDEAGLSRFLLELSLLDSAYQRSPSADTKKDRLLQAATRYRVDIARLQKAVAAEMAAKREKKLGSQKG